MEALRSIACSLLLLGSCSGDREPPSTSTPDASVVPREPVAHCPTEPDRNRWVRDTDNRHRALQTWLDAAPAGTTTSGLVDAARIAELNARFSEHPGAWRDPSTPELGVPAIVDADIQDRLAYLEKMVGSGTYVEGEPGSLAAARALVGRATAVDHQRLVVEEAQLWCVPLTTGLYKTPPTGTIDLDFDRNACTTLHPGERVRVLRRDPSGDWLHVHAGHTVGWLHRAALTPRLSREDLDAWQSSDRLVPLRDDVVTIDGFPLRLGVSVPLRRRDADGWHVLVPTTTGLKETIVDPTQDVVEGFPPLRRDLLLRVALSELAQPYGWGGRGGERDCSQYLRDVFATFGVQLARHSSVQAELGTHNIDVEGKSDDEKRALLEKWHARGVVILYMPGHVMLYLGREGGHDWAVSSLSEWLEPCEGGPDTVHRIDLVEVTHLELGRDTERTAFIERISRLVVFAPET